jgi:hypothetical protein
VITAMAGFAFLSRPSPSPCSYFVGKNRNFLPFSLLAANSAGEGLAKDCRFRQNLCFPSALPHIEISALKIGRSLRARKATSLPAHSFVNVSCNPHSPFRYWHVVRRSHKIPAHHINFY